MANSTITPRLTLEMGHRFKDTKVTGYPEASRVFRERRDESGEGASTFPFARLLDGQTVVGKISYNGRVWTYDPEERDYTRLVYCPGSADVDMGRPDVFNDGRESVWGKPVPNPHPVGSDLHKVFELGAEFARSCSVKKAG